MRILFVCPYLPSPPRFGGQRRLDGLMRGLVQRHEVSVLAFNKRDPYEEMSLEASRKYCHEVFTVSEENVDSDGREKRWLQLRSLASRSSYDGFLAKGRHEFQARLSDVLAKGRYDVVQIEFAQMGAYDYSASSSTPTLLVLDEHNIEYDLARRSSDTAGGFVRGVYYAANWRKLKVEEQRAWAKSHGVVVTSARDRAVLNEARPNVRTTVVPNGVDIEAFQPTVQPPDHDRILFFGAVNYFPNQDGIVHFLDHTFPIIQKNRPQTKLWIVGPGARKPVHDRAGANVELTGFVDDVNEYLDQAAVVIVPLRIGGGTRLKIVEAMAKGKAIVSTRIGAEGLDVVHGTHALLADEPEDFAREVERLLADPELCRSLGEAARKLAVERYSWSAVVKTLEGFYDDLRA